MSRYRGPKVKVLRKFIGIQNESLNQRGSNTSSESMLPGFSNKRINNC